MSIGYFVHKAIVTINYNDVYITYGRLLGNNDHDDKYKLSCKTIIMTKCFDIALWFLIQLIEQIRNKNDIDVSGKVKMLWIHNDSMIEHPIDNSVTTGTSNTEFILLGDDDL